MFNKGFSGNPGILPPALSSLRYALFSLPPALCAMLFALRPSLFAQ